MTVFKGEARRTKPGREADVWGLTRPNPRLVPFPVVSSSQQVRFKLMPPQTVRLPHTEAGMPGIYCWALSSTARAHHPA